MPEDRRTHLFAFGLLSSFAALMLAIAAVPSLLRGQGFMEPRLGTPVIDPSSHQALLYRLSGTEVIRSVVSATSGRSIVADLDAMMIRLYEGDREVAGYRILSRGREGTFWETPQGEYEVRSKISNHYSSIGHVWMPYSMQFYGNFFIHGWPYYENGKPVPPGYSGGCIRLSTEDAKRVYEFADVGTPIMINGGPMMQEATTTFAYYIRDARELPDVGATGFIVADLETGSVLWERKGSELFPAHGLTSLMTALTAVETVNQYKVVRMSELILGKPVPRRVEKGFLDEIPIGALIYPLVFSANDVAASAFSEDRGEQVFVREMNEKAKAIGMQNSVFASSTGSAANLVSPRDAFIFLRYLREDKPFILTSTLKDEHVVNEENGKERFSWKNQNPWREESVRYQGGVLPEQPEARSSAAALWNLPIAEFGERPIAIIVLDSQDPRNDVDTIRQYVEQAFIYAPVLTPAPFVAETNDPTPSLWSKMKKIELISRLLNG
jgi:hypothetical protein